MLKTIVSQIRGKRIALAQLLARSHAFSLAKLLPTENLVVFNFHRIRSDAPDANGEGHVFSRRLFGPTQESFRSSLKTMLAHADPVSESDLIEFIERGRRLPKHGFMVTMDDGYRDNYELAFPVLKELRIPAILFIPTQIIEERLAFWWDHLHWCIANTKRKTIQFRGQTRQVAPELADELVDLVKNDQCTDGARLVAEVAEACDVTLASREQSDKLTMSWDQIREIHRSGIGIGSHAHTHRILSKLSIEEQREELTVSKRLLESKLGAPTRSIAYPVGSYADFNIETKQLARECGFKLGFSFLTGSNNPSRLDPMDVRRLDEQIHPDLYQGTFAMPWLFGRRDCAMSAPKSISGTKETLQ